MTLAVQVEGLVELEAALKQITKRATEKGIVRRALTQAAEPTRDLASALAPDDPSTPPVDLHTSIMTGPKTSASQGAPEAHPGDVTVYVGPVRSLHRYAHAVVMEFGSFKDKPEPYMRPAWEATKDRDLDLLGYFMWAEIDAAAHRISVRAARVGG